jgi:hypothetical protein
MENSHTAKFWRLCHRTNDEDDDVMSSAQQIKIDSAGCELLKKSNPNNLQHNI